MFHSRNIENKTNRLHERVLELVYDSQNLSFRTLLLKDKNVSIHQKHFQLPGIETYKAKNGIANENFRPLCFVDKPHKLCYNML